MSTTSNSTKHKTTRTDSKNERKVPPIIIKRTNKNEDNVDLDRHTTHNSDNQFRSPRRTSKIYDSPTKKLFTTPNRYSILDNININDQEMFSFNDNILPITQTDNQNNHPIQSQSTEDTPKIPPLFVLNITQYSQFRNEITKIISNEFTSTSKYDKIKINLETVDDFRTLTKYLNEKKYLVKSVTRLTNKNKIPTSLMAVQLMNHHKSQEVFKLSKLLNCIVITEPRRKSKDPSQCTNCQRFGHLHKTCKLQPRCGKCNLSHHYSNCDKTSEIPPNCVNYNGAHSANYKGCTYFKNIKKKKTNNIKKALLTKDDPPKDATKNEIANNLTKKTINLKSYANILKGNTNPAQNNPTILLEDLNSKNEIWGCLKTNPNGNKLFPFTSELRIIISPPSKPTFHRTGRQPDILDIALVSNLKAQLYHQVANELGSDHVPVITTLENLNKNLSMNRSYKNNKEIDTNIQHLTESIKNAIKSVLSPENPKKSKPRENSSLPSHIQYLIKEKHKARRIWQKTRKIEITKRLNQLTRKIKWELDNNRFDSYKTYLSTVNPNDASLWNATKRILKQNDTIPPLKVGLAKYETNIDKCKIFAQHFENCFTTETTTTNITQQIDSIKNYSTETNIIHPCSPKEIKQIIDRLANKKSPGHDLITNKILKNLTPKALVFLASLINSILRIGYFPNSWK
ncbi:hypothetical protein QTP88_009847 [Uroleucon formosanum]